MSLKDKIKGGMSSLKGIRLSPKYWISRFMALSRGRKVLTVIIFLFVLLLIVRVIGAKPAEEAVQQQYIAVNAQTVKKQTISTNIVLSGRVYADKEAAVIVKTPGRVESIAVKAGDMVEKGQVLFSLDKSDMQASYDQAEAAYRMAEANYRMNKEKIDNAKIQLERYKELYEIGAVSKAELEQMELQASDASLQAVEAQRDQAKAQYDSVSSTYNDLDVKAPIDGIVTALNVRIGDMVANTSPAAMVVDMDSVYVDVSVSEKVINSISREQEALVEIASAYGGAVKGQIDSLSLAADARTGKYQLKVYIENDDHLIKAGMFAKVTIASETKEDVLVVPADAVVFRSGRHAAYVIEDNAVQEREVITGLENGKQIEIVSGLNEGDILIIKGMNFIKTDSEIKIVELDGEPYLPSATGSGEAEGGVK